MTDLITSNDGIKRAQQALTAVDTWIAEGEDEITTFGPTWAKAVVERWRARGRQVVTMHPDLVSEVTMATTDTLNCQVFNFLPYIDPLVIYADPIKLTGGFTMLGFFAHGMTMGTGPRFKPGEKVGTIQLFPLDMLDPQSMTEREKELEWMVVMDTDSDRAAYLTILVLLQNGKGELACGRMAFPFRRNTSVSVEESDLITLGDIVATYDELVIEHQHRGLVTGERYVSPATIASAELHSVVLGSLLYLCATVIDAQPLPRCATKAVKSGNKPITMVKVGWRVGPALSRFRRSGGGSASSGNHTGRMVAPHQRKAHIAIRWTGPGRTIPRSVLILPTWIHPELIGMTDPKTAHRAAG